MESKVTVLGHPVHPMVVTFPIGLLATATGFDLIGRVRQQPAWGQAADLMIAAGLVTGLQAGLAGAVDWAALPAGTRAKRIATIHGLSNLGVMALFGGSWLSRRARPDHPSTAAVAVELIGVAGLSFSGWLGGELVDRLGVGVHHGAHLNAPSSLSDTPATATERLVAD